MASSARKGDITYRAAPYVCGAIGAWSEDLLKRLQRVSPTTLRTTHKSGSVALFASAKLTSWSAGGRSGYLWAPLAAGPAPSSWRDASERRLAAGVEIDGPSATLHTDSMGLQELYTRRIGDALYFSVRMEPLIDLDDAPLHVDWAAWANILYAQCPVGSQTPFQEIQRLNAATGLTATGADIRPVAYDPSWLAVEPDDRTNAAEAVELIQSILGGPGGGVTLSGGWDSRLIAMLLVRRGASPEAWTVSKDDGYDWDVDMSRPVAQALGLRHHVVIPPGSAFLDELDVTRRRLGFQTLHHFWLMPLVREIHRRPKVYYDGLAGDTLFRLKKRFIEPGETLDRAGRLDRMWYQLSYPPALELRRTHLFAPGVPAAFEELSRRTFYPVAERFVDHHEPRTLVGIHTRGARAFAQAPLWLFGPEVEVRIPFLHPDVVTYFLSVDPERKFGGAFFKEMLTIANPTVAALPSTNDNLPWNKRKERPRHQSPEALARLAAEILSCDDVVRLLSPEVRFALRDTEGRDMLFRQWQSAFTLQWAALFAAWRTTYANRLKDDGLVVN